MRAARNVAIVMLLALPVAFLPRGDNFAEALLTALTPAKSPFSIPRRTES